ncbi:MAG: MFS transporter [Candidatus Rokubacteria bacterium]|nr:MFS transporter [Candidatus Rokubacteria bacterium]
MERPCVILPSPVSKRREQVGWYVYDWANSAFPTTVVTVFLGPYLTSVTKAAADAKGFVYPLGIPVSAGSFYPYVVSLSVLGQVIFLPILGAIADYSHRKKQLLMLFAYLGALATLALYFVRGTNYLLGGALFVVANVSFGASVVFYNAFLPEIAAADERDAVSSKGWALGYLGGGLLLAMNLAIFSQASALGLTTGEAVRVSLASAGAWWAVFTLVPLATLRSRRSPRALPPGEGYVGTGFRQLRRTLGKARRYPQTLLFLLAFLLYNDGIQTVIALASQFGQEELGLPIATLTQVILMVQFVAFGGALLFNWVARALGTKRAIIVSLVIWIGTVGYAYGFLRTSGQFFVMGAVIALVLGGSQALSRSVYSLMIPKGQESEYFSLYEVSERGTSWLGPLLFGLALQFTGSYRSAILSLVVFFVLGLLVLAFVNVREAVIEAGNEPPAGA